jgi:hypothetical protein
MDSVDINIPSGCIDVRRLLTPDLALLNGAAAADDIPNAVAARRVLGMADDTGGDLTAALIARVYDLPVSPSPSRSEVRYALLAALMERLVQHWHSEKRRPPKSFKMDEFSRGVYRAFAGIEKGTVQQAEAALARRILGLGSRRVDLAAAIVRHAREAGKAATVAPVAPPQRVNGAAGHLAVELAHTPAVTDEDGTLGDFANEVRRVAKTLETKPYKGRVAIAQVYDAALARGVAFGTLDEFKSRLADAAREGLLDLERYDIAGPFDAALKERSRTRLGRDERHFIVNHWM